MLAGVKQQVETLQIALDTSEKQNQQNVKKLEDAVQKSQKLHQKSDDLIQNCQGMQREIVGLAARARKAEQTCKEKKAEYNQTVVRQAKEVFEISSCSSLTGDVTDHSYETSSRRVKPSNRNSNRLNVLSRLSRLVSKKSRRKGTKLQCCWQNSQREIATKDLVTRRKKSNA